LDQAIARLAQGDRNAALRIFTSALHHEQSFMRSIAETLESEKKQADLIALAIEDLEHTLFLRFIGFSVASLGLCAFFMSRISRSIQRSIDYARRELLRGTERVGAGAFDTQISLDTRDELSIVAEAFNHMTENLKSAQALILRQQHQIASSSKMSALGEMAGGMAHEINNPLAVIRALSEEIAELVSDESINRGLVHELSVKLGKLVGRVANIIQGLRAFSRDGSQDPFESIIVQDLLERTLDLCRARLQEKGVRLVVEGIPNDLHCEGRSTELSQVILNLLTNAQDAVMNRSDKWIQISVAPTVDWLEIRITDSGGGIPPQKREKLFQPFYTTKEIGAGLGMGLSTSLGIVRAHGGDLHLDTEHEHTCFVIRLPWHHAAATPLAA
jgi:C4-dicarboxylate-specific signal transduction histidine kinase